MSKRKNMEDVRREHAILIPLGKQNTAKTQSKLRDQYHPSWTSSSSTPISIPIPTKNSRGPTPISYLEQTSINRAGNAAARAPFKSPMLASGSSSSSTARPTKIVPKKVNPAIEERQRLRSMKTLGIYDSRTNTVQNTSITKKGKGHAEPIPVRDQRSASAKAKDQNLSISTSVDLAEAPPSSGRSKRNEVRPKPLDGRTLKRERAEFPMAVESPPPEPSKSEYTRSKPSGSGSVKRDPTAFPMPLETPSFDSSKSKDIRSKPSGSGPVKRDPADFPMALETAPSSSFDSDHNSSKPTSPRKPHRPDETSGESTKAYKIPKKSAANKQATLSGKRIISPPSSSDEGDGEPLGKRDAQPFPMDLGQSPITREVKAPHSNQPFSLLGSDIQPVEPPRMKEPFPMSTLDAAPLYRRHGSSSKSPDDRVAPNFRYPLTRDSPSQYDSSFLMNQSDPEHLCPFCDEPWPENPSPELISLLVRVRKQAWAQPRYKNPLGLMAPMQVFIDLCTLHRDEHSIIPEGIRAGWPSHIDFDAIPGRLRRLRKKIDKIVRNPHRSQFFEIAKDDVESVGARKMESTVGQFASFEKTRPGYYGEKGFHMLTLALNDLFPDLSSNVCAPLSVDAFLYRVLIPEAAVLLIRQDFESHPRGPLSPEEALRVMYDSQRYGVAKFPDTEDGDVSGIHVEDLGVGMRVRLQMGAEKKRKDVADAKRKEDEDWTNNRPGGPGSGSFDEGSSLGRKVHREDEYNVQNLDENSPSASAPSTQFTRASSVTSIDSSSSDSTRIKPRHRALFKPTFKGTKRRVDPFELFDDPDETLQLQSPSKSSQSRKRPRGDDDFFSNRHPSVLPPSSSASISTTSSNKSKSHNRPKPRPTPKSRSLAQPPSFAQSASSHPISVPSYGDDDDSSEADKRRPHSFKESSQPKRQRRLSSPDPLNIAGTFSQSSVVSASDWPPSGQPPRAVDLSSDSDNSEDM